MANTKSSKARIKTNIRDRERNVSVKTTIKTFIKKTKEAITSDAKDVSSVINNTVKVIDKAASKGIIHKKTAARKKSRLMKQQKKAVKASS